MSFLSAPENLARKTVRKIRALKQERIVNKKHKEEIVFRKKQLEQRRLATVSELTSKRLHLGCGAVKLTGFCNVDIDVTEALDIVDDITLLTKFPSNFADQIYACHVLEHLPHNEILPSLQQWHRVLKPGGEIRISVPDIDRIVKIYMKNWQHFQTRGHSPWIGLLYGGQTDKYDFHKTGFNFCWLSKLLEDAGFTQIKEYPHEPHFVVGTADASLSREPFGEFVSLNILGIKL